MSASSLPGAYHGSSPAAADVDPEDPIEAESVQEATRVGTTTIPNPTGPPVTALPGEMQPILTVELTEDPAPSPRPLEEIRNDRVGAVEELGRRQSLPGPLLPRHVGDESGTLTGPRVASDGRPIGGGVGMPTATEQPAGSMLVPLRAAGTESAPILLTPPVEGATRDPVEPEQHGSFAPPKGWPGTSAQWAALDHEAKEREIARLASGESGSGSLMLIGLVAAVVLAVLFVGKKSA